jgi:hypothetical protein
MMNLTPNAAPAHMLYRWTFFDGHTQPVRRVDLSAASPQARELLKHAYLGGGEGWGGSPEPKADSLLCVWLRSKKVELQSSLEYGHIYGQYDEAAMLRFVSQFPGARLEPISGGHQAEWQLDVPLHDHTDVESLLVSIVNKHLELVRDARAGLSRRDRMVSAEKQAEYNEAVETEFARDHDKWLAYRASLTEAVKARWGRTDDCRHDVAMLVDAHSEWFVWGYETDMAADELARILIERDEALAAA